MRRQGEFGWLREPAYFAYWGKSCHADDGAGCHLLPYHCLDVAAVGRVYLERHPFLADSFAAALGLDRSRFISFACLFLSLHDLGKFAEGFQGQLEALFHLLRGREPRTTASERHDSLGFVLWDQAIRDVALDAGWFALAGSLRRGERALGLWAAAVTGHHGQPPSRVYRHHRSQPINVAKAFSAEDTEAAKQFAHDVRRLLLPETLMLDVDLLVERIPRTSWWLAGLTVLCDWIGSNQTWFRCVDAPQPLETYWREMALPQAGQAVGRAGIIPAPTAAPSPMAELFPELASYPPTPLQALAQQLPLQQGPQLFVLEDVTGAGKTEAAAMLTHRLAVDGQAMGAYVALPTMATANAMYRRLAEVYGRFFAAGSHPSLVLAHGRRDMDRGFRDSLFESADEAQAGYADGEASAGARCTAWLGDHRKKALLADFGIGTLDQALLAALPSKHQSLRLLGLARKVLVVDEVHACDSYMLGVLRRLVSFHTAAGGSTVLLSATLPQRTRQALVDAYCAPLGLSVPTVQEESYPLLTHVGADGCREHPLATRPEVARTLPVELLHEAEAAEALVEQAAAQGQCVCWVRNSVDDAIESYRRLAERLPAGSVRLFHARFALCDRLRIESESLETFGKHGSARQRQGQVLIATQVVEQSLDLDFDVMVSDLAPIDLLIQRAGRLHRHRRSAEGDRVDGPDGRPAPVLRVLTPEPVTDPDADWLRTLLPRTAAVYRDHFRLWRTATLLADLRRIRMPEEARRLIEAVYGEDVEAIPPGLVQSAREAEGQRGKEISLARQNALELDSGYRARSGELDWWEDMVTPTRLGEASVMLRLGRVEEGEIRPWCEGGGGWRASEVSVRAARIAAELENPLLEQARATMADKGRWSLVLPLALGDGVWRGDALDGGGKPVSVGYSVDEGLLFS